MVKINANYSQKKALPNEFLLIQMGLRKFYIWVGREGDGNK